MLRKIISVFFICCFCALLVIPIFFADFRGGAVSAEEKRTLAPFPSLEWGEDHTFSDFTAEFESWCGDNIGFRNVFQNVHTVSDFNVMGIAPKNVHIGKDGWYFYTSNQNIEIATGEHIISEETMEKIAYYQRCVSDYYRSLGKEYYLLLIPSKASVYPEYLTGGSFTNADTTVDRLTDYLAEHTDVRVINLKESLVEHKNENQLYLKTDTHWTSAGAYVGYQTIMNRLLADGTIDRTVDFDPELVPGKPVVGDLSNMIGNGALPPEERQIYEWERSFSIDRESEQYLALDTVLDRIQSMKNISITREEQKTVNDSPGVNRKSLLLYCDSMYYINRGQGTEYFAESFSDFQCVRVRNFSKEIDDTVDPDIVIFECYERLIESVLTQAPPYLPIKETVNGLTELPAQRSEEAWIGRNGFLLSCKEGSVDGDTVTLNPDHEQYTFYGWAADFNRRTNLKNVYLLINGEYMLVNYGMNSPDIVQHFGIPEMDRSRFSFTLSRNYITDNQITEMTFIMESAEDGYKYEPVTYYLEY